MAIIVAIFIVICVFRLSHNPYALTPISKAMVGSLNDWQKERQFRVLNDKKDKQGVKVVRSGVERVIDIKELLVGDVALLEPGEIVPCDGTFISSHNIRRDKSGATGESDAVNYDECITLRDQARREGVDPRAFVVVSMTPFASPTSSRFRQTSLPSPLPSYPPSPLTRRSPFSLPFSYSGSTSSRKPLLLLPSLPTPPRNLCWTGNRKPAARGFSPLT